jgi:hypothetical protein
MYFCLRRLPNRLILVEINKKLNFIFQAVPMTDLNELKLSSYLDFHKEFLIMLTDGVEVIRCDGRTDHITYL